MLQYSSKKEFLTFLNINTEWEELKKGKQKTEANAPV